MDGVRAVGGFNINDKLTLSTTDNAMPPTNLADVVDASRLAIATQHAKDNIGVKVVTKENVKKNVKDNKRQKQQNNPNKLHDMCTMYMYV